MKMTKILLFQKDFTNQGNDRLFLWSNNVGRAIQSEQLVLEEELLICHDYWLIAPSIYKATHRLPKHVVDVEVFRQSIGGAKIDRSSREQKSVAHYLSDICEKEVLDKYMEIFTKKADLDEESFFKIAPILEKQWGRLCELAKNVGELERQIEIEIPIFNYMTSQAVRGIRIDKAKLRAHKKSLEHDYFMSLKRFATSYNLPFEVPSDEDVCEYLEPKGFDFSGVSIDYVLKFVPMQDNFANDLLALRKTADSRDVLSAMSVNHTHAFPIVDIFGTITSRIYYKDPALQHISKKHRDIIIPDEGFEFSYVDYDQFEVGIMAALSGDKKLLELYNDSDIYLTISNFLFQSSEHRKIAKRLFLSYAYGMSMKGLMDAANAQGAERGIVKDFFRQFSTFEKWKDSINSEYKNSGRIGTILGNNLIRKNKGELTQKEKRSSVSQVVQGTASLIYKKTLLRLKDEHEISIKLPMHDAALIQHPPTYDKNRLTTIFSDVMTQHFNGIITGKASIEPFYKPQRD